MYITEDSDKEKQVYCSHCKQSLPANEFSKNNSRARGYHCFCKACSKVVEYLHRNTLIGFCNKMVCQSIKNSKDRNKSKTRPIGHTLTKQDVISMWHNQKGLCYYTSLPMKHTPNTSFMASLERFDPKKDYCVENCALVVWEMNGSTQWTSLKCREYLEQLSRPNYSEEKFHAKCFVNKSVSQARAKLSIVLKEGVNYLICSKCKTEKNAELFCKRKSYCKECNSQIQRNRKATVSGYVRSLFHCAKKDSKTRAAVTTRKADNTMTLTFEEAMDVIKEQKCLCHYSGVEMRYGPNQSWKASIERIDNSLGYHKDNICFVCHEFNVAARVIEHEDGTQYTVGGWNKDKVALMTESLRKKLIAEEAKNI